MFPSYQDRVKVEKGQLDTKIAALAAFGTTSLYKNLPEEEKDRLNLQMHAMQMYSTILKQRIAAFPKMSEVTMGEAYPFKCEGCGSALAMPGPCAACKAGVDDDR